MKLNYSAVFSSVRLLALVAACAVMPLHADESADVSQLLRAGKLTEALTKADAYLSSKPNDPQMRFLKGVIQRSAGKTAEAELTFTKLTQDYPELPEPYNNLAVLYAAQGQYDKARVALEMAIRTNPTYATAHENIGDVYARLASQAYNKALQLDSNNAAVPPKLALIKELFGPNNKGQRPSLPAPASAAAPTPPVAPTAAVGPASAAKPMAPAATPAATPAAVAKPALPDASSEEVKQVEKAVQAWATAWSAKDMAAYLGAYGKEFTPPGKRSRAAWEDDRRKRIVGKTNISVKLDNFSATVDGGKAVAKFKQHYRAGALVVSSRKTLELVKTGDRWLIAKESTGH